LLAQSDRDRDEGIPSAVHQHWPGLEIQHHLRRRRKGYGRNEDLIVLLDPYGTKSQIQGSRRRVDSHCMLTAHMVGEILLKLLYLWAGRPNHAKIPWVCAILLKPAKGE
jgi:hypothetical protein